MLEKSDVTVKPEVALAAAFVHFAPALGVALFAEAMVGLCITIFTKGNGWTAIIGFWSYIAFLGLQYASSSLDGWLKKNPDGREVKVDSVNRNQEVVGEPCWQERHFALLLAVSAMAAAMAYLTYCLLAASIGVFHWPDWQFWLVPLAVATAAFASDIMEKNFRFRWPQKFRNSWPY